MADKKTEKLVVGDATRDRWELVSKDDYPLLMLEYARMVTLQNIAIKNSIDTIKVWVVFFGLLVILGMIISFCTVIINY